MAKRWYLLEPVTVTDQATGDDVQQPAHADRDDVHGFNGSLIPAPNGWGGSTTADGEVFFVHLEGETAAHDAITTDANAWAVGDGSSADIATSDVTALFNNKFHPEPASHRDLMNMIPETSQADFADLEESLGRKS